MARRTAGAEATTYLLEGSQLAEVVDFVAELGYRGLPVPEPKPALVNADGTRLELPEPVFEALVQVATAMARGQGVTVMPLNALLTTQEAADLLGISRPTLVRLLADGELPYEQRGRHRRILLADLLAYEQNMRRERRQSLERMAQEGQAAGIYEATAGPVPQMRLPLPWPPSRLSSTRAPCMAPTSATRCCAWQRPPRSGRYGRRTS